MKKSFRKRTTMFLILILAVTVLSSCASGTKPSPVASATTAETSAGSAATAAAEKATEAISGTITFMDRHLTEAIPSVTIKATAKMFEEKYPGTKIELVSIPVAEGATKFLAAMAAGNGPDTLDAGDPGLCRTYVKSDYLYDLTDWYTEMGDKFWADFSPSTIDALKIDGRIYAVPQWGGAYGIIYNKKYYADAGITKLPATWEEFIEVAKKTTKDTNNDGTTDVWGFATQGIEASTARLFLGYVWSNGGTVISEDYKQANLADPIAVQTLQILTDMVDKYHVCSPNTTEINYAYLTEAMAAGKVAAVYSGPWLPSAVEQTNPEMKGNLGVYQVPSLDGKTHDNSTIMALIPAAISSQCKNIPLAKKWMEFLLSKECQTLYANDAGFAPTNLTVVPNNELMGTFASFMKTARTDIYTDNSTAILDIITKAVQEAFLKVKTPQQALESSNDALLKAMGISQK